MRPGIAPADMTEKVWQQQVVALFKQLGWRGYHTLRSKGSQPGYPDLTLAHPDQRRIVFLELKTETGKLTDRQADWISTLRRAGAEVYVVRPRHMQALASILGNRTTSAYAAAAAHLDDEIADLLEAA